MLDRYRDRTKFIPLVELHEEDGLICISPEDNYDIAIDAEKCYVPFEGLKPFFAVILKHIGELDNIVQQFDNLKCGTPLSDETPYILNMINVPKTNFVTFEYICTDVNSEFNALFEYKNERFYLREFGMVKNIHDDWDIALR